DRHPSIHALNLALQRGRRGPEQAGDAAHPRHLVARADRTDRGGRDIQQIWPFTIRDGGLSTAAGEDRILDPEEVLSVSIPNIERAVKAPTAEKHPQLAALIHGDGRRRRDRPDLRAPAGWKAGQQHRRHPVASRTDPPHIRIRTPSPRSEAVQLPGPIGAWDP